MSKSHDRLCNETRGILCAKFVDVDKVMVHAKFQSAKPFGGSNINISKIYSSLTADQFLDNGYVEKQSVACKDYCAEYW